MSTYRLGLFFRKVEGPVPGRPISHVYVKTSSLCEYKGDEGLVFLTPREHGPEAIESHINGLIDELQTIKRQVRKKYAAYARELQKTR